MSDRPAGVRVGAAAADVTPPLEAGILMSSVRRQWAPFLDVRLPLHARVLLAESAGRRVALVSMELLGLCGRALGGRQAFRHRILRAAGGAVTDAQLVLAATHTHAAPDTLGLTGLPRTAPYQRWVADMAEATGRAVALAARRLAPCTLRAGLAEDAGPGIYRRILTTHGIELSHPPVPEEIVVSREGPTDPRVSALSFDGDNGRPLAVIVQATCHPVHEMCLRRVSPDYPGVMCAALEARHPGATVLYFNGCAGNINPPTVSGGPADADAHGHALADAAGRALAAARPVDPEPFAFRRTIARLPARTRRGRPTRRPVPARLAAVRWGQAGIVFLPGEPFVEVGLGVRRRSPLAFTAVAAYAEDTIGYVPTDRDFAQGGYEIGPGGWSFVAPGSADRLETSAVGLLQSL